MTSDYEKFTFAVTATDPKYYNEIRDIILNPPQDRSYETLKCELIKRVCSSQKEKTRRLLEFENIKDGKPSQFLRHFRN